LIEYALVGDGSQLEEAERRHRNVKKEKKILLGVMVERLNTFRVGSLKQFEEQRKEEETEIIAKLEKCRDEDIRLIHHIYRGQISNESALMQTKYERAKEELARFIASERAVVSCVFFSVSSSF
jgi:hypothetical protein